MITKEQLLKLDWRKRKTDDVKSIMSVEEFFKKGFKIESDLPF